MKKEKWRPVVGYEDRYLISDRGNLIGLFQGHGKTRGKRLTPVKDKRGYYFFMLNKNNKYLRRAIHQIVAWTFIGPCPDGMVVNHKDGNKTNNHPSNLEYVTRADNVRHAFATGLANNTGENHGMSKLTTLDVVTLLCLKIEQREAADLFGVAQSTVSCIRSGRAWKHVYKEVMSA